jgi:hypothetical protein
LKLHVILPQSTIDATDIDLRLSLVSLKNIQSVVTVHAIKIERELERRGVSKHILHQDREKK